MILAIERMAEGDPSTDVRRLKGSDELRLRVGEWRVRFKRDAAEARDRRLAGSAAGKGLQALKRCGGSCQGSGRVRGCLGFRVSRLATSGICFPSESICSASLSLRMICSGVRFRRFT